MRSDSIVYQFEYAESTPIGDVRVYSAKELGQLLATMTLDEEGRLQGLGKIFDPETGETVLTTEWVDGKREGEFRRYHRESGELVGEGVYKDGKVDGELIEYTQDGDSVLRKYTYANGALNGAYEEYDDSGNVIKKTTFIDNVDQQLVENSRQIAEELTQAMVAAGHPAGDMDSLANATLSSLECIERESPKSHNSSRPKAEIEEMCGLRTAGSFKADLERSNAEDLAWQQERAGRTEEELAADAEAYAGASDAAEAAQDAADAAIHAAESQAENMDADPLPSNVATALAKPSFDCGEASSAAEKMVCGDVGVADADARMMAMYKVAMECAADKLEVRSTQRSWLKRRDGCANTTCMLATYSERIAELERTCSG